MTELQKFETMIQDIDRETQNIRENRQERNGKYRECMTQFKDFLNKQTRSLEEGQAENTEQKKLVSDAFANTFEKVIGASDVTIRKIKQTYNTKKEFWDNVIKLSSEMSDIELKKEYYLQKKAAEDSYLAAIDHQRDKHKPYALLTASPQSKQQTLQQFQATNKRLEEQVGQGSHTLHQWQQQPKQNTYYHSSTNSESDAVIKQFMSYQAQPSREYARGTPLSVNIEGDSSTVFLNNFQRKR